MPTNFKRTFGNATSPLALSYLDDNFSQLEAAGTSTVSLSGAQLIGYMQSGTGAVSRTMQDKGMDYLAGADYGVVADGTTDDTTAINNTIAAAVSQKKKVHFTGPMLISSTISIASPVHIVFTGAPGELTHAPDSYFKKATTMTTSAVTITAFGVVIEGGGVEGQRASGETGDGITVHGRSVTLNKVTVRSVGGHGFTIGKSSDNTNADFWQALSCIAYSCGSDGFHIESNTAGAAEANLGIAQVCVADSNVQDGFNCASGNYNGFLFCNGTSNGRYGLNLGDAAYSIVMGGDWESNTTAQILNSSNASFTRWINIDRSFVVSDSATAANQQVVLHRTGLDQNLVAMDGNAAGAVRLGALNDAQSAAVPLELQGDTFTWIGGTFICDSLLDISGSAGGQVKFPGTQNASADVNTLDDYEEGTFTPGVTFGGGSTGMTFGAQVGSYTKIGQRVLFEIYILLTAKGSSTGTALVTGLPFTTNSATNNLSTPSVSATNLAAGVTTSVVTQLSPGGTTVNLLSYAAGAQALLTEASFTDTTQIIMSGSYRV